MIFARRMVDVGDELTSWVARFREDFPFSKFVPIRICAALIIVYGELVFERTPQALEGGGLRTKSRGSIGRAAAPEAQCSRCQASLYLAYLLVGSEV
jgi:hypothetical protein